MRAPEEPLGAVDGSLEANVGAQECLKTRRCWVLRFRYCYYYYYSYHYCCYYCGRLRRATAATLKSAIRGRSADFGGSSCVMWSVGLCGRLGKQNVHNVSRIWARRCPELEF